MYFNDHELVFFFQLMRVMKITCMDFVLFLKKMFSNVLSVIYVIH